MKIALSLSTLAPSCLLATGIAHAQPKVNGEFEELPGAFLYSVQSISRAIYKHNDGYDVFTGYIPTNDGIAPGALTYFNKNSPELPTVHILDVPEITGIDGTTLFRGRILQVSVSGHTLFVGATIGQQYKYGKLTTEDQGRYALFEAQLNDSGTPGAFTTIAQTGEHGLPKQLADKDDPLGYGYVLWYGAVPDNSTYSTTTFKPTVIFADKATDSDDTVFSIYQKDTDNSDQWAKIKSLTVPAYYDMPYGGLRNFLSPIQVISNQDGTVLLFEKTLKQLGDPGVIDIRFNKTGAPESTTLLNLPAPIKAGTAEEDALTGMYYETQQHMLYVTMEKSGIYSTPIDAVFAKPTALSWTSAYKPSSGNTLYDAAPMIHNGITSYNVSILNRSISWNAYSANCLPTQGCTEYPGGYQLSRTLFYNIQGDTYYSMLGTIEKYVPNNSSVLR